MIRALVSEYISRSVLRIALEKDLKKPMPDGFYDNNIDVVSVWAVWAGV